MTSERTKNIEELSIIGFQKNFLKKMLDFFDNNVGKFIYYICDIESMDDNTKLDLDALYSLRRKRIIKKAGIKEGKKADVLSIDLSSPTELERKIGNMNKADVAIEEENISDLNFYHRLDQPCIFIELERGDIDIYKAKGYLLSLSPDLYQPVKNKEGKYIITISKSDGIYYDERIKEYKYYAPLKKSKRFELIHLLLDRGKAERGDFLIDFMRYKEYSKLKHEIDEINSLFKKKLLFKEKLIIKENSGGYSINFKEYFIRETE